MSGISWQDVEQQCKNCGEKPIVRSLFRQHFESSGRACFQKALFLLEECLLCLHRRSVVIASLLLDELNAFVSSHSWDSKCLLAPNDKTHAMHLAIELKNSSLTKKMCQTFNLVEDKMTFMSLISDLLARKRFSEACSFATALELQRQYNLEDIVIPLIFQDKVNLVESYVCNQPDLQVELVKYLDSLTVGADACEAVIRRLSLSDVNRSKLRPKTMGKLVTRLVKLYDIPPEICPNLSVYRSIGAIKYLVSKKCIQSGVNDESCDELIKSAVSGKPSLALELVTELVCANEPREALRWALIYDIPQCQWPASLKNFEDEQSIASEAHVLQEDEAAKSSWNKESAESLFLQFPLDQQDIHIVDDVQEFLSCVELIVQCYDVLGIDGEWKPTFGLSSSKISLLQLAVWDEVFLLDMISLQKCLDHQHWDLLVHDILANPNITKLGYGFTSDMEMLAKILPSGKEGLKQVKRIVDLSTFCNKMKALHPELVSPTNDSKETKCKGLSQLTNCLLGQPLDKTEQFSDWERRPLRPSQILYAALDSYCLLQVYDALYNKALKLGLDFDDLLHYRPSSHNSKNINNAPENKESEVQFSGFEVCEFRVVVDTMLQGLGRHLRLCGVDAVILDNCSDHDECAKIAQKESRFILTSGTPYQMLKGHVPRGMCMDVPCGMTALEQVQLVFARYKVRVKESDIFSRCPFQDSTEKVTTLTEDSKRKHRKKNQKNCVPLPPRPIYVQTQPNKTVAFPEYCVDDEFDDDDDFDMFF